MAIPLLAVTTVVGAPISAPVAAASVVAGGVVVGAKLASGGITNGAGVVKALLSSPAKVAVVGVTLGAVKAGMCLQGWLWRRRMNKTAEDVLEIREDLADGIFKESDPQIKQVGFTMPKR